MRSEYGASFSLKYCHELGINPQKCLESALNDMGLRRLRLMSYWDVHEPEEGHYDFSELDWQINMAEKYGAKVTLCIGLKQPRWPESHWPAWAEHMPASDWHAALMKYIEIVVNRYKSSDSVISWQLENEALLRNFGLHTDIDRARLKLEFKLVRSLDNRPIIMSTSDTYGIPLFGPVPDKYGFSIYRYFYRNHRYRHASRPAIVYRIRAAIITFISRRPVFIHELQAEPWGPRGNHELDLQEQLKSMNLYRVREAIEYARKTKLNPIDLWGLEWWYWLKTDQKDDSIWSYVKSVINSA